jgi:hypothetical protein
VYFIAGMSHLTLMASSRAMNPCDPMAVAVDWLDAYRDASVDQIVAMYSQME